MFACRSGFNPLGRSCDISEPRGVSAEQTGTEREPRQKRGKKKKEGADSKTAARSAVASAQSTENNCAVFTPLMMEHKTRAKNKHGEVCSDRTAQGRTRVSLSPFLAQKNTRTSFVRLFF